MLRTPQRGIQLMPHTLPPTTIPQIYRGVWKHKCTHGRTLHELERRKTWPSSGEIQGNTFNPPTQQSQLPLISFLTTGCPLICAHDHSCQVPINVETLPQGLPVALAKRLTFPWKAQSEGLFYPWGDQNENATFSTFIFTYKQKALGARKVKLLHLPCRFGFRSVLKAAGLLLRSTRSACFVAADYQPLPFSL